MKDSIFPLELENTLQETNEKIEIEEENFEKKGLIEKKENKEVSGKKEKPPRKKHASSKRNRNRKTKSVVTLLKETKESQNLIFEEKDKEKIDQNVLELKEGNLIIFFQT